ncbi:MAG: pyrroline-5-carboxylate reductase [Thermofilum sp.]
METVVAVLGAGKIGKAFISAVLRSAWGKVIATARSENSLAEAARLGALATRDNREAVKKAGIVVLSVKPFHFPQLLREVGGDVWEEKLVVSVMAGVKLSTLASVLEGAEVYRAMPNLNAYVGLSSTAVACNGRCERAQLVEQFLGLLGRVYWVPEEYLDVWTGLAGSGPAFISEIVDALAMGAVAAGLSRELAYMAVLDVLEGTAQLLRSRVGVHPAQLRDEVATPAGTTIRGLMVLESEGVKAALMKVVEEAARRSRVIGLEVDEKVQSELEKVFLYGARKRK